MDDKMFLESRAYSFLGTYFRLGYVTVPRIEEAFDSWNILSSASLDPLFIIKVKFHCLSCIIMII